MMNSDNPTGAMQQQAKDKAGQLTDQVRDVSADVTERVRETAKSNVSQQKGRVADTVGSVADALRQTGQHLDEQDQGSFANFAHMAADRLDEFAGDLQNKSVDEIVRDVENFARRDPQLFLGGAVVLGLFASRFFKSSSSRRQRYDQGGYPMEGGYPYSTPRAYGSGYQTSNRSYGGPAPRFDEQDLAEYRRETMNSEYETRPRTSNYTTGQPRPASSQQSGSFTTTGGAPSGSTQGRSGTTRPSGSTYQGQSGSGTGMGMGSEMSGGSGSSGTPGMTGGTHNTPPSSKPGETGNQNPRPRKDE